jgi:tetratricopeptide (TPR) repeat protein
MAKRSKKKRASPRNQPPKPKLAPQLAASQEILPAPPSPIRGRTLVQALVMVAATLWIYGPALHGAWLWDDDVLVTDNFSLRSLGGLGHIWFSSPLPDWPLTSTMLWIEWHLWGNETLGYHLCSLALHICSGLLIWRVFNRLGLRLGWLGGLLFVIHPLAVESVAWISEIKNTLSLPFFLLSFDAWLDAEEKKPSGYLRSILYFLAAMLAKTSTVMLPLVILLYCWWKRGRVTRQEIKRVFPHFAVALVLGLVSVYFQNTKQDYDPVELGGFVTRSIGAGTALFFYLEKFILPIELLPIYPKWSLDPPSLLQALTIPALAGLLLGLWTQRKGWGRHALFGLGFFVLNLLPVLGLVKMQYLSISWVADHLVYLPIIGLIGLTVAGLGQIERQLPKFTRPYAIGTVAGVMALLAWESRSYASLFVNQETLWTYTLQHNPQAWEAHGNLGAILMQTGRLPEAEQQFEEALKIKPDILQVHNNLGVVMAQTGRTAKAVEQFDLALKINPYDVEAHNNLGLAMAQTGRMADAIKQYELALKINPDYALARINLGKAFLKEGQADEATVQFEWALKIDPNLNEAYYNLGTILMQAGRLPEAEQQFEQALKRNLDNAEAHYNLGVALMMTGSVPEALEQFEQAVKLNPYDAVAHNDLGIALKQTGRIPEAVEQFEQALKINPNYAKAHYNLGIALVLTGRVAEAIEQFEQAIKINPGYAKAHESLGDALEQTGRIPEAVDQFEQALKIDPSYAEARNNLVKAQALQKAVPAKN